MNIGDLLKTKRAKTITGYIYSWGASVVLVGALFKLQHWPYSGVILAVGLLTEAVIFFVSAFEPPLEIPDWSKVYPELKEDFEIQDFDEVTRSGKNNLEDLLKNSELTPDLLKKVSFSLSELSNTAKGISDISSATLATDMYVKNLTQAGEVMGTFGETNAKASQHIHHSVSQLLETYENTTRQLSTSSQSVIEKLNRSGDDITNKISESGSMLANSYKQAAEKMQESVKNINHSGEYAENMAKLNKNLASLNMTVESQLKGAEDQFKAGQRFNSDLGKMNEILSSSVEELKRYQENAMKLNQHLEALNTIYGNMLGALNYKK
ncbi:MAG: gliding motility protein GldL [Bacteroidota bacterium]